MRIAALDLGTNSFHLLIADVHADGSFTPLAREKEMLRLGDSVSREGFIPPDSADLAVATVRRMKMLAEAADATEIVACATSAIRLAANGDELVDRIERETGVEVEVINGLTEARLIFGAIRASVLLEPAPALCFDLGGGSLEVMVGTASELLRATSENLGVARLTADFVHSDPISKGDRRALRAHLTTALRGVAREVRPFEPKLVVGSSGTLEDIAAMVAARRGTQVPASLNQLAFARDEFLPLHDEIVASKASERRRMVGLEPRRVDLIVAGSMFLATAMDVFEFVEMTISEWALREGILLDAIGHHDPADWTDDPRAIRRASAAIPRRIPIRSPASRWSSSTRPPTCTGSMRTTGSCSSTPRSCTTSGSTWRTTGITGTRRTSSSTVGCAASPPRRSRFWPPSPGGTGAASRARPRSSARSAPPVRSDCGS